MPRSQPRLGLPAQLRGFVGAPAVAAVKRGRIGLRVVGRNAQRSAISTVEASASGRSANSAAISARVLKRCSGVSCRRSVSRDHAALGDADQRVMRLVVVGACAKNGSLVATSGMPLGIGELDQLRLDRAARSAGRGAAARHRAGRRTARASVSQRARREMRLAGSDRPDRAGPPARR